MNVLALIVMVIGALNWGLIGLFHDDYNYMFLFCAIMFALGLLVITQVRHGESFELTDEELKEIRNENED